MLRHLTLLACLAGSAAMAGPMDDIARLEVLPGWQTGEGTQMAGLRITLAPGWKTYWRAPGDAGIPPQLDLKGSDNVSGMQMHWPTPEVMDQAGLRSIGYHDGVVVPLELWSDDPAAPLRLAGSLDIGVCEDICIPVRFEFSADLPRNGARDGAIMASLLDQPMTGAEAGAGAATCTITPIADGLSLTAALTLPRTGGAETVVIETGDPLVWVSPTDMTRSGATMTATADLVHVSGAAFALDRSAVRITVLGQDRAVDIQGCQPG